MMSSAIVRIVSILFDSQSNRIQPEKLVLSGFERVLVINQGEIGDLVLMLPLVREMKLCHPGLKIDLLAKGSVENIVELCPHLERRYFIRTRFDRGNRLIRVASLIYSIAYALLVLRKNKYDLAIVPRWDTDTTHSVFFAFFSGARTRIAYSEKVTAIKSRDNRNYDSLYSSLLTDCSYRHEVERNLSFLEPLGIPILDKHLELWFRDEDKLVVDDLVSRFSDKKIIAICPVASEERRRWQIASYQKIVDWLISGNEYNLAIVGGNDSKTEAPLTTPSNLANSMIDFRGVLTLRQSALLLKRCVLYVGNDTGPMHLAAAVGTPVVEISCQPMTVDSNHAQSPSRFAPWGVPRRILQPKSTSEPCPESQCESSVSHCINNISIEEVIASIGSLLDDIGPKSTAIRQIMN